MKSIKRYSKGIGSIKNPYFQNTFNPFDGMNDYPYYPIDNNPYFEIENLRIEISKSISSGYPSIVSIQPRGTYKYKTTTCPEGHDKEFKIKFLGECMITNYDENHNEISTINRFISAQESTYLSCEGDPSIGGDLEIYLYSDDYSCECDYTIRLLKYQLTVRKAYL